MTVNAAFRPGSVEGRTDLITFTGRIVRLDPTASIRLQGGADRRTAAWAIALGVLVRRDFNATLEGTTDVTVPGGRLLEVAEASVSASAVIALPDSIDAQWRATLPPTSGWNPREDLPAAGVLEALDFAGSALQNLDDLALASAGDAMLSQTVIMVDRDGLDPVEVPMRLLLAMNRLGFFSADDAEPNDVVRVASKGAWIVAATKHGAAFRKSSSLDLLGLS